MLADLITWYFDLLHLLLRTCHLASFCTRSVPH